MCLEGPNHPPIDYVVDDYQHGLIDRRQFLARATALLGLTAATALVEACTPQAAVPQPTVAPTSAPKAAAPTEAPKAAAPTTAPTAAPTSAPTTAPTAAPKSASGPAVPPYGTVPADAADIVTETVTFPSEGGAQIQGYLARPKSATTPQPAVIVVHENRGLTPHEQDMARRYAKAGFVALAVDLLSRQGGSEKFPTPQEKTAAIGQTKDDETVADMAAAVKYLKGTDWVKGSKVGITGYCWGGGRTNLAAVRIPDIAAAVPYYGPVPQNLDEVKNMQAALLAFYGGTDQRINAGIPGFEEKLKQYNKTYEIKIYDGAGHAFNNDTGPNFNAAAAADAWQRAVTWFNKYLRS